MHQSFLRRTEAVRRLRISHSRLSEPQTCKSWRKGDRKTTGEVCVRGSKEALRRRARAIRTMAVGGKQDEMTITPVDLFVHPGDRYLVPGGGSCPKANDPGDSRASSSSFFPLHLTSIFRIFCNPGRQLDPVVVILLNGKIRD